MVRYLRQYDDDSCGPISIINAMKWLGIRASKKSHLKRLQKECKSKGAGTLVERFDKVIRKYIPRVRRVRNPSLYYVDLHLSLGRAVILAYDYTMEDGKEEGHLALCIGKLDTFQGHKYIIINAVSSEDGKVYKQTEYTHTADEMYEILNYRDSDGDKTAEGWFI